MFTDLGWNVWAKENRRLKQECEEEHLIGNINDEIARRTPPTGGSGVTQNTLTPVGNVVFEQVIDYGQCYRANMFPQNTFYREVVQFGDCIPTGINIGQQPVQILPAPQELKYEPGWKDRCDDLEETITNLQEWCQELLEEIETLKRDKADRYNKEVILC